MDRENVLWTVERVTRASLVAFLLIMSIPHTAALQSILLVLAVTGTIAEGTLTGSNPLKRTVFDIPILCYSIIILLKTFTSIDVHYSIETLMSEFLKCLVIFYLVTANMNSQRYVNRLLITMLISLSIASVVGLFGYLEGSLIKSTRAISYFGSFGRAAFFTSMLFPIALGRFMVIRGWWKAVLLGVVMAVSIAFMLMTLSRGSWISTLTALFLLTAVKDRRMFVILMIVIFIIPWFLPAQILDRAQSMFLIRDFQDNTTFGDRAWLWQSAMDMIRERPILGAGYGSRIFFRIYPDYIYSRSSGIVFENAHNLYMQMTVELGLLGLSAFGVILITAGVTIFRLIRKHPGPEYEGHLLGIMGSLTVFVMYSLTTYRYENEIALLFWYLLACIAGLHRLIIPGSGETEPGRIPEEAL
ncbi:O-antigen ligase family protein [bacterium]|nr:O-antigen ligase family protein [candidate division CSSED10-310 bacterium]